MILRFFMTTILIALCTLSPHLLSAEDMVKDKVKLFPYTGKIQNNKVRVRIKPSLDSKILCNVNKDDLVLVLGEDNEYLSIQPLYGMKAYVFRTYVLDGLIEGKKVNVRLAPTLDSSVITQFNTGDKVLEAIIDEDNHKWFKINMPQSARLYVHNDYVKNVGDSSVYQQHYQRLDTLKKKIAKTELKIASEVKKKYEEMNIVAIEEECEQILTSYREFNEEISKVEDLLELFKDKYLAKKVVFLENKVKSKLDEVKSITQLHTQSQQVVLTDAKDNGLLEAEVLTDKMKRWSSIEQLVYEDWKEEEFIDQLDNQLSTDYFYQAQIKDSQMITGYIEAYNDPVKNKPGDYLIKDKDQKTVAYIYSTRVDLQKRVGKQVSILVYPRSNNHFAYPAYFVLSSSE